MNRISGRVGTALRWLFDVVSIGRCPRKVAIYLCAALAIGLSVLVANGFLLAAASGGADAVPTIAFAGFEGNSLGFGSMVVVSVYLVCAAAEWSGRTTPQLAHKHVAGPFAVAVVSGFLFFAWLPVLLAFFPGILYHDTVFQLAQFFGGEPLDVYTGSVNAGVPKITDHHPIVSTLLFSFFAWLGQATGSAYGGLSLYVILQAIVLAVSLATALVYARRTLRLGRLSCIVLVLFFAAFPLFPVYAASLSKDVTFAPFFVLFSTLFIEIVRTRGRCFERRGLVVAIFVISFAMVTTKKIGIYVVIACMLIAFVRCRSGRAVPLLNGLICAVLVYGAIPYGVFPLLGAGPGSSKEMLSVPFEQTALYVKEHPDDVSSSEEEILDDVLTYETLADRYRPDTADYVKNFAPESARTAEYLVLYVQQGLRHPVTYARAFLALEAGFVGTEDPYLPLFESAVYDKLMELDDALILDAYPDTLAGSAPEARSYESLVASLSQRPVLGLLFTKSLYAFVLPLVALAVVMANRKPNALFMAPYCLFALLLFVSPVSIGVNAGRYVFPLVCSAPLIIGVMLFSMRAPSPKLVDEVEIERCACSRAPRGAKRMRNEA